MFSIGIRVVVPVLLPQMKGEFALTNTTAGMLVSAMWIAYAVAQLPGGALGDRFGERRVLALSMVTSAVGVLITISTPFLGIFVLGVVLTGFGTGLFGTTRITVVTDIYPDRGSTVIGVGNAAGNLGNVVLPLVATGLLNWFTWRGGLGVTIPVFAVLTVGLWWVIPDFTSPPADETVLTKGGAIGAVVSSITGRAVLVGTAGMVLWAFIYQGFVAFFPTYLITSKGLTQGTAAVIYGIFFFGGVVLQPIMGSIADRHGPPRVLIAISAVSAVSLVGLPFVFGRWALVGLAALLSVQLTFWPVVFSYVVAAISDEVQGSSFGMLRTFFVSIGAIGPVVVGLMADWGLFDGAFFLLGGAAGTTFVLFVVTHFGPTPNS